MSRPWHITIGITLCMATKHSSPDSRPLIFYTWWHCTSYIYEGLTRYGHQSVAREASRAGRMESLSKTIKRVRAVTWNARCINDTRPICGASHRPHRRRIHYLKIMLQPASVMYCCTEKTIWPVECHRSTARTLWPVECHCCIEKKAWPVECHFCTKRFTCTQAFTNTNKVCVSTRASHARKHIRSSEPRESRNTYIQVHHCTNTSI